MAWIGGISHTDAVRLMEDKREALVAGDSSAASLLLCEHPSVITLGKHAKDKNILLPAPILRAKGIEVTRVNRGGDVTYHGPGQLMIYPVVRVGIGVRAFLQTIAEGLSSAVSNLGVEGTRWRSDEPGLWIGGRKLAACGLHLSRGVSIHGFSLNVSTPPQDWQCIVPCGLPGPGPVSLAELMPQGVSPPSVADMAILIEPMLRRRLRGYGLDQRGDHSIY